LENAEIAAFFGDVAAQIAGNRHLRIPQIDGHRAALSHFAVSRGHAIEQIPVGCGKSGLIAILPFGLAVGRVLVIAPNLEIRRQLAATLDVSGLDCFYRRTGVLDNSTLQRGPFRAILDGPEANIADCNEAHIVVTNIQQLASSAERWLPEFPDRYFDLILVDEGHHNVAPSWQRVFERFPEAKVVSLTATPFRSDEQRVQGQVIYRYPFRDAMHRGYIKDITSVNVAPAEIYFTFRGETRRHSLDEVLQLREEDWFSRGVALAEECNVSIVDASILWLNYLREGGTRHQLIAVACSLDHARQVRGLYQERGLEAREIHSGQSEDEREQVLRDLRNGVLDAIVQVRMLGEGFDHPSLSVAAIFNPFRSLSPYIQFVGRIMRVIHQNAAGHPDNRGIVVSHVGLNIDRHWDDFKYIDDEDQQLVHGWLIAGDTRPTPEAATRRRLTPEMIVHREVIDRFISEAYLDPSDDTVIDNAMTVLREQGLDLEALGFTREDLRRRIVEARQAAAEVEPARLPVQPQRHRQNLRTRLNERVRTAANRILEALGLAGGGQRVARLGGTGAANDLAAVTVLMNRALNRRLDIGPGERADLDRPTLERAMALIDAVADEVEASLRERLGSG
jgi:superfamily II DNA or RNA helicase